MARDYPVGKAQQMVLDALGITASGFGEAQDAFDKLGIVVNSQRQGRKSVPAITVKSRHGGGFTSGGDGEAWREYDDVDLSAVEHWIVEDER